MGNINLHCVPVIPLEEKENGDAVSKDARARAGSGEGAGGGGWATKRPVLMSELDDLHEPPTTLTKVLSNALYAMAFHKHLALTNRSENYEFFQAVSHFTHEASTNKQQITDAARMINNLYVAEDAPLRVALGDEVHQSIKKAIEEGHVTKQIFDAAQGRVLFLMERDSLEPFLSSTLHKELRKRINNGEMDTLMQEDLESVKDIMSKEFIDFLGDPDLKEILSSQMGVDKFRQYLVIEFAEEGLDLLIATRDMLDRNKIQDGSEPKEKPSEARQRGTDGGALVKKGLMEGVAEAGGDEIEKDCIGEEKRHEDGSLTGDGNEGEGETAVVAPFAKGGVGPEAGPGEEGQRQEGTETHSRGLEDKPMAAGTPAESAATEAAKAEGAEGTAGDGERGEVEGARNKDKAGKGEFDIRQTGKDIFERFIRSGCGAECNLPGTVVAKVSRALTDVESTSEDIAQAFELVDVEIFKLLAYDPFLRFKRSGMYTKYCMTERLKTQRSSLSQVREMTESSSSFRLMSQRTDDPPSSER